MRVDKATRWPEIVASAVSGASASESLHARMYVHLHEYECASAQRLRNDNPPVHAGYVSAKI